MNERIKELARQAGCKVMDDGEWYIPSATGLEKIVYTSGVGLEKFAELIVRECLAQVARVDNMLEDDPAQTAAVAWVASSIADHFGVEE
jgi:hypothetical protein